MSAFYDMELLFPQDINSNSLHINSMLDKKAVGAPGSGGSFSPRLFRRNSTSNVEAMSNFNQYSPGTSDNLKENHPTDNSSQLNQENRSRVAAGMQQKPAAHINSPRYKTELCRPFEENGSCKYGEICQFAHGYHELRSLCRHPKYKTEPCRTFHTIGFCPYGPRCHFIHNADERRPVPAANANVQAGQARCVYSHREVQLGFTQRDRQKLHHSLSFSGFSTHHGLKPSLRDSPASRSPPPSTMSCINSSFSFPGQDFTALLVPLSEHPPSGYGNHLSTGASYGCPPSPPTYNVSHLQALHRLSQSPVFEPPPSPDSLSDRESYASGSLSSSGSLSGSESPSLDAGRRLPIFSRLSTSDD